MTCICCGGSHWAEVYPGIIGCRCGYQRMQEEVSLEDLRRLYTEEYYTGAKYHNYPAEKAIIQANLGARLRSVESYARRYSDRPPRDMALFEVGSAYGFFLELARARFASVGGVDISEDAVRHAREVLHLDVRDGDLLGEPLPSQPYDVICMWDTIEHLHAPQRYTQRAFEMLRRGGLLFVTTGDVEAWMPRLQKRRWRLYDPPQHVHYFCPRTLGMLLFRQGFRVLGHQSCAFVHSVEQIVHGLAFYNDSPGTIGQACVWLHPRLPQWIRRLAFPIDVGDIFLLAAQKP